MLSGCPGSLGYLCYSRQGEPTSNDLDTLDVAAHRAFCLNSHQLSIAACFAPPG